MPSRHLPGGDSPATLWGQTLTAVVLCLCLAHRLAACRRHGPLPRQSRHDRIRDRRDSRTADYAARAARHDRALSCIAIIWCSAASRQSKGKERATPRSFPLDSATARTERPGPRSVTGVREKGGRRLLSIGHKVVCSTICSWAKRPVMTFASAKPAAPFAAASAPLVVRQRGDQPCRWLLPAHPNRERQQSQAPSKSLLYGSTVACNFCKNASALTQTGALWSPRWASARHTRSGNTAPASAWRSSKSVRSEEFGMLNQTTPDIPTVRKSATGRPASQHMWTNLRPRRTRPARVTRRVGAHRALRASTRSGGRPRRSTTCPTSRRRRWNASALVRRLRGVVGRSEIQPSSASSRARRNC